MSDYVQITLIICGTIITCYIISCFKSNYEKEHCDNGRFGYCKSPTYPRPLRPGFPGTRQPGTSSYEAMTKIKPPSTGSGIK
jgi:hypothetical protein